MLCAEYMNLYTVAPSPFTLIKPCFAPPLGHFLSKGLADTHIHVHASTQMQQIINEIILFSKTCKFAIFVQKFLGCHDNNNRPYIGL